VIRRVALPVAGAAAILAGATLAAAGLGTVLRPPTRDVLLATKELAILDATRNGGARITIAGERLDATCSPEGRTALVSFDTGGRIRVRGTRVTSTGAFTPALAAAVADLSGVHRLLATELADRVRSTSHLIDGVVRWQGRPALLLRLGDDRPRVDLVVSASTLRPLAVRFRASDVQGSSMLLPPHPDGGSLIGLRLVGC
jgi:hypothetical protein